MYVLTGPTAGKQPGTGAVQKYWNRGLPLLPAVIMSPSSLFLCLVVVVSLFWDFGSLFRTFRCHSGQLLRQQQCDSNLTLRRPSGQLLRQRQSQRKTMRGPCCLLLRQLHTQNELQPET